MIGIPVKIKNVSIYPYLGVGPVGPVVEPVITNGVGTYTVSTLTTNVFYNLNLSSANFKGKLSVHDRYIAVGETENGEQFTSPWMYCTEADKTPQFGRTISMLQESGNTEAVQGVSSLPYVVLGPLTDITVSQVFPPPAIGQIMLIENGKGNIIATKVGTPHEMGVEVTSGKRTGKLIQGMKNIMITGKTKTGETYTASNLTVIDAGEPAVFLRTFP